MTEKGERRAVNARIPEELFERVKEACDETGLDLTGVTHQALRLWLRDAPQAMDDIEMWALRAFRRLAERHPGLRAKAVLDLSVYASDAGVYLPPEVKDALVALSQQFDEASSQPASHSRDVRRTLKPHPPKAR